MGRLVTVGRDKLLIGLVSVGPLLGTSTTAASLLPELGR